MKIKYLVAIIILFYGADALSKTFLPKFDKAAFYAIIKTGNKEDITNEIAIVTSSLTPEKDGYEGFLLMRKAGLVTLPAEKLKLFKAGRIKMETAIANDDNTEYHFLRLIIEEKAPKIVKYQKDLEADKEIVIKAYKNLPPVVQQAIMDYSKNSKILHPQDF